MYKNKDEQNEAIQTLLYNSRLERESKWMEDPEIVPALPATMEMLARWRAPEARVIFLGPFPL